MAHRLSLALFVSGILVASCFVAPAGAATAGSTENAAVQTDIDVVDADSAATAAEASAIALAFGHKVQVASETDETTLISALPTGEMEMESTASAVRMARGDGWVDIDPTLEVTANGTISPVATEVPLKFSSGGNGPLAQIQAASGEWISEYWPLGELPEPILEGATARYEGVLEDVDLLLTASATGMTEVIVIKNADAAKNPDLQTITLSIEGARLTREANGTLAAETDQDEIVSSSSPTWWDSSHAEANIEGPGGNGIPTDLEFDVDHDELTLEIDSATESTDLVYPVFVDPDWVLNDEHYWYVDRAYPNQSYLDGANASGSMRLGYISAANTADSDGKTHLARMFWKMDTNKIRGKHVTRAYFEVNEVWSFSCTKSTVELWRVGNVDAGASWNDTSSSIWLEEQDARYVAFGHSSACPDDVVSFGALEGAQYAADNNAEFVRFGMRAADETTSQSWKRFSESAVLRVTYNSIPDSPTALRLHYPSRVCGTPTSPAAINGQQNLTLRATTSDDDPNSTHTTRFTFEDRTDTTKTNFIVDSAALAAGSTVAVLPYKTATPLIHGHVYRYSAWSSDGTDRSAKSDYCYVKIDNDAPGLPTVEAPAEGTFVGQPITATFGSTEQDDISVFAYWWTYTSSATSPAAAPALGTSPTVTLPVSGQVLGSVQLIGAGDDGTATVSTAPVDNSSTLWVASYDSAGNVSKAGTVSTAGKTVNVDSDPSISYETGHAWLPFHAALLQSPLMDENQNAGTDMASTAPIQLGAGIDTTQAETGVGSPPPSPVLTFNAASGAAVTSHSTVDVGDSFTVAAWIRPGPIAAGEEYVPVSQAGAPNSSFAIKIGTTGHLEFCVRWDTTVTARQCVVGPLAMGTWVHVVGIWDSANSQLRILIDNSISPVAVKGLTAAQASNASVTDDADNGVLVLGSEKTGTSYSNKWTGAISDVSIFPGVISNAQLTNLYGHSPVSQ